LGSKLLGRFTAPRSFFAAVPLWVLETLGLSEPIRSLTALQISLFQSTISIKDTDICRSCAAGFFIDRETPASQVCLATGDINLLWA
jgi:hypothetical protein